MLNYHGLERREILPFVPEGIGLLLDIGCGEAGFGAALKQSRPGLEVWGVEPVQAAADVAAQRLDRVICGMFSAAIALPEGYFDVITFNDSLEHMPDEVAALQAARGLLKPGGYVVCSVPNVRYFENLRSLLVDADWQYTASGILDRTHLRFFTKKSIQRTVQSCGFDILQVQGINSHWWTGPRLRVLKMLFGQRIEDTRWQQFVVVAKKPG